MANKTKTWYGAESLDKLTVPLEELSEHPNNPRRGDVPRIRDSLRRFGQVRPIVATTDSVIVAGHHVYKAAQAEGWSHVAVVKVSLSDEEAKAYMLADNRLGDVARYEETMLAELLGTLNESGLLEGTGWTPDEVDDLLADLDAIPTTPLEEFKGGYAESDEDFEERATRPTTSPEPLREVVLMYRPGEYQQFGRWVAFLEKVLDTRGSVATVYAAMQRLATEEGYDEPREDESEAA
jgi:hypothetical protein